MGEEAEVIPSFAGGLAAKIDDELADDGQSQIDELGIEGSRVGACLEEAGGRISGVCGGLIMHNAV